MDFLCALFGCSEGMSESQSTVVGLANWSCVEGLLPLVRLCAERCLSYLADSYVQQVCVHPSFVYCISDSFFVTFQITVQSVLTVI
jgi:hypothetical protein